MFPDSGHRLFSFSFSTMARLNPPMVLLHTVALVAFLLQSSQAGELTTVLPQNLVPLIATDKPENLPEIYSVPDEKGNICTMASLEASLVIWPKGDQSQEVRIKMPNQVTTATNRKCPGIQSSPLLIIMWSSFQLCFYISKSGDNWVTNQIAFVFNTSEVPLGLSSSAQNQVKTMVSQVGSTSMMQAPLGYSYRCLAPKKYTMVPIDGAADNATLLFTQYQFQSYLQDETSFGEEIICSDDVVTKHRRRHRDSSVMIAVGSMLAVLAVITVIGYAIYRHIKIKSVGYNTME